MLKWSKNVKIAKKTGKFCLKMQENTNLEKHACQYRVTMETSNWLGQDMSYHIVAR